MYWIWLHLTYWELIGVTVCNKQNVQHNFYQYLLSILQKTIPDSSGPDWLQKGASGITSKGNQIQSKGRQI